MDLESALLSQQTSTRARRCPFKIELSAQIKLLKIDITSFISNYYYIFGKHWSSGTSDQYVFIYQSLDVISCQLKAVHFEDSLYEQNIFNLIFYLYACLYRVYFYVLWEWLI